MGYAFASARSSPQFGEFNNNQFIKILNFWLLIMLHFRALQTLIPAPHSSQTSFSLSSSMFFCPDATNTWVFVVRTFLLPACKSQGKIAQLVISYVDACPGLHV